MIKSNRYMKRFFAIFFVLLAGAAVAAPQIQIKKDSGVAVQDNKMADGGGIANVLGTAVNLLSAVNTMKTQEKYLDDSCAPDSSDLQFVNSMVREYARIDAATASEMFAALPPQQKQNCSYAQTANAGQGVAVCYDWFSGAENAGRVWADYPMASLERLCPPEKPGCLQTETKTYSNIYEIYRAMNWTEDDLLPNEIAQHTRLMKKMETCSPELIKQQKMQMTGALIQNTINSIGKPQDMTSSMTQMNQLMQQSGTGGQGVNPLMQMGTMMLLQGAQ